jgi:hypothetical protein
MTPTPLRRLTVRGTGKDKRKQIREAVEWMVPALVGKRMTGNLDITVRFVQNLGRYVGDCEWLDDNISPRQFLIRISTQQSLRQQLITLAHELTHMKQFVKNELFDYSYDADVTRWRRQIIDTRKIAYRDLPWEKEAYATQKPLTDAYMKWMKSQS